jgi:phosphatidate cytidylyltransferase
MTVAFTAIMILDGWMDGSLTASVADNKEVRGTLLCILIALLAIPAQLEMSKLAELKALKIFLPVSITGSILFGTSWYWAQFIEISPQIYLLFLSTLLLLATLLYQYMYYGTTGVLANCGANCFSICYLGILSSFALGIRIDFGLWQALMFVFVVKSADIGAYAIGTLFGRHKFSPKISPLKTWEGMGGAVVTAVAVAIAFAAIFDIMQLWAAIVFGVFFAFIGQVGDLAESMLKRDAAQKDSASLVPTFGGVLDIIDSPLAAVPFAYLFFMYSPLAN